MQNCTQNGNVTQHLRHNHKKQYVCKIIYCIVFSIIQHPVFSPSVRALFSPPPKAHSPAPTTSANQRLSSHELTAVSPTDALPPSSQVNENRRRRGQRKGEAHKEGTNDRTGTKGGKLGKERKGKRERTDFSFHFFPQLVPVLSPSPWGRSLGLTCHGWTCGWDGSLVFGVTHWLRCCQCRKWTWERAPPERLSAG